MNGISPRHLPRPLLVSLSLAALGLLLAATGYYLAHQAEDAWQQAQGQLQQLQARQTRLQDATSTELELNQAFAALEQREFFQAENRLEAVARLEQIRLDLGVTYMDYEFAPQRHLEGYHGDLRASSMVLNLHLNHELELPAFLDLLSKPTGPFVGLRECRLSRIPARPEPPLPGANLAASCKLDWITPGESRP